MLVSEFPKFSPYPGHLFPNLKYANLPMASLSQHKTLGIQVPTNPTADLSTVPLGGPSVEAYNCLVDAFDLIQQDAFYGRTIGFYYTLAAHRLFTMLSSIMAGFANSYQVSKHFVKRIFLFVNLPSRMNIFVSF